MLNLYLSPGIITMAVSAARRIQTKMVSLGGGTKIFVARIWGYEPNFIKIKLET
jgi:hypothetical protein